MMAFFLSEVALVPVSISDNSDRPSIARDVFDKPGDPKSVRADATFRQHRTVSKVVCPGLVTRATITESDWPFQSLLNSFRSSRSALHAAVE